MTDLITESAGTLERTKAPGRMLMTIITAGEGSSGTYPAETIKNAVESKLWAKGTLMNGNHMTTEEAEARPEGDIWNAIGKLAEDAFWNEDIQGAQAVAEIYPSVKDVVFERAKDMGISIRGGGRIDEAGTVTELLEIESVDLVTKAGRGGSVVELLESARRDIAERNGLDYRPRHAAKTEGSITVDGSIPARYVFTPTKPEPDTLSTAPAVESATSIGGSMEIKEAEYQRLSEAAERVQALETERDTERDRADKAEAALAEADRRKAAQTIVAEAFKGIEAPKLQARLVESAVKAQDFDAETFKTEVTEAAEELAEANSGVKVTGFGDTQPADVQESADFDYDKELSNIFEGGR